MKSEPTALPETFLERLQREDKSMLKRYCIMACIAAWCVSALWLWFFVTFGAIRL